MQVTYRTEQNYNCEKKVNKLQAIKTTKTISCFSFNCGISIWLVAIIAKGAIVKISKSLLLLAETKKINTPIKKEAMIFLKEACVVIGLLESEENIDIIKNKATVA